MSVQDLYAGVVDLVRSEVNRLFLCVVQPEKTEQLEWKVIELHEKMEKLEQQMKINMPTMLEELMKWHASLLQWLDKRQNDPNTIIARKLSDPNEKPWQAWRRRRKLQLEQQLRKGAYLAYLRETNVKRFRDMSAIEQRALEDHDNGKLRKCYDRVRIRKPE